MSILRAPPSTLITIVKKAPRNVTKAIDISFVGQKIREAGTQANGGIGLRISKGGKKTPRKYLLTASNKPKGIPIIIATKKPVKTLLKLDTQLIQYPTLGMTPRNAAKTSEGGGTKPMPRISTPVQSSNIAPMCHIITKHTIAATPRLVVVFLRKFPTALMFVSIPG